MTMLPPPDLLAQVLHAIEGDTVEKQVMSLPDGSKQTFEVHFFGPDKWVRRVHERGILTPLQFLAIVHFVLFDFHAAAQNEQRIVDGWYRALLDAVETRVVVPRDRDSMLPLAAIDDWNNWVLSLADANALLASVGMEWTCTEVAAHLFNESSFDGRSTLRDAALASASGGPDVEPSAPVSTGGESKRSKNKLTSQQKEEIVRRVSGGETQTALANEYGISRTMVGKIINRAPETRTASNPFGKVLRS